MFQAMDPFCGARKFQSHGARNRNLGNVAEPVRRIALALLVFVGLMSPSPTIAAEAPERVPLEAFAKLPQARSIKFSPDGQALAYISALNGRDSLVVRDSGKSYQLPSPDGVELNWARWVSDQWLILSYGFPSRRGDTGTQERRLYAVDRSLTESRNLFRPHIESLSRYMHSADTRRGKDFLANEVQIQDIVISMLPNEPDHILLSIDADRDGRHEIRKVEIPSGKYETVIEGEKWIQNWTADAQDKIRFGFGIDPFDQSRGFAIYKNPETGKWKNIQDEEWYIDDSFLEIVTFTDDPRYAYTHHIGQGGRKEIAKFDMVAGRKVEALFADDQVDVSGLIFGPDGASGVGKPVGVFYSTEEPSITYFDQQFASVKSVVDAALPGGVNWIGSALPTKQMYIILHESDVDPGRYFLLDMGKGQLSPLAAAIPAVDPSKMAPVRSLRYDARDGTKIPAYLTLPVGRPEKGLPLVVLPHGGPHSRDYKEFDRTAQFLANRGYAVLQPNFRGSSGFGLAFKAAGYRQWGGLMQDDVTDGVRWLIDQGIADAKRICIMGGSYGGYSALMGAVKTPDLYRCAISINGVTDLPELYEEDSKFWGGSVWKESMGLEGEKAKAVSPRHQADKIKIPVLLIVAKDDRRLNWRQSRAMHKAVGGKKRGNELVVLEEGGHGLVTESSRLASLRAVESFLEKHLGPGE